MRAQPHFSLGPPRPGGPIELSPRRKQCDSFCVTIPKAPAGAKETGLDASIITVDRMP